MCAVNSCDEYYAGAHMLASHQQGLIGDWHTAALGHMITMHQNQRGRISAAASVHQCGYILQQCTAALLHVWQQLAVTMVLALQCS